MYVGGCNDGPEKWMGIKPMIRSGKLAELLGQESSEKKKKKKQETKKTKGKTEKKQARRSTQAPPVSSAERLLRFRSAMAEVLAARKKQKRSAASSTFTPSSASSSSSSSSAPTASLFDTRASLFPGIRIERRSAKGRVLCAARAFTAGDLVFTDAAVVAASWDEEECIECAVDPMFIGESHSSAQCKRLAQRGYSEAVRGAAIAEVEADVCAAISPDASGSSAEKGEGDEEDERYEDEEDEEDGEEGASGDSLDRARCLIRCLVMRARGGEAWERVQSATAELCVANRARDEACAAAVRGLASVRRAGLVPAAITDAEVGQLLGAMNTNSHTLDLGGSAVFPLGAMMNSNCAPNCTYYTTGRGSEIAVIATRAVAEGEELCIDYGNNYYRPTGERQQGLLKTYGFRCDCDSCTSLPDRCRAFWCPREACGGGGGGDGERGIVAPRGAGEALEDWACTTCGSVLSSVERDECVALEETLEHTLDSEEAIEAALAVASAEEGEGAGGGEATTAHMAKKAKKGKKAMPVKKASPASKKVRVHPTHYMFFWCYRGLFDMMLEGQLMEDAERVWGKVLLLAEAVLPDNHPELIVMYDQLAQLRVPGDMAGAKAAWGRALELANAAGDDLTRQHTGEMLEDPPTTRYDMAARYKRQTMER